MPWSVILTVIETVDSSRRSELTLINAMHKSNCGVRYKRQFFDRVIIYVRRSLHSFQTSAYARESVRFGVTDWKIKLILFWHAAKWLLFLYKTKFSPYRNSRMRWRRLQFEKRQKKRKKYRLWMKKIIRNQWKRASNAQSASSVNSLLCSQSVSLQHQQASDASPASTDNRWASTLRKFRQSPVHPTTSASSAKPRHFIANDIAVNWLQRAFATDNRQRASDCITIECSSPDITFLTHSQHHLVRVNRQPSACIWPFHDRMQQPDNQTIPPVHLTSSRSDAGTRTSTAFHLIALRPGAAILTSRQPPVHLMTSASDAALTTSLTDNSQRASDRFTVGCSSSDITFNRQCIWWHRHQVQHFWHQQLACP